MRRLWTPDEDALLAKVFPDKKSEEVARILNRSIQSVRGRASLKRLKKSQAFFDDPNLSGRTDGSRGISSRFKKGSTSFNKGMPMEKWASEDTIKKFKANTFKKGNKPHNTTFDGKITIRKIRDIPYRFIRVSENNWEFYHRYIWKQSGLEIPKGYNVVFKDRNTLNCIIENLDLISNEELMKRNTIHRYPDEIKQTIRLLSKLKKTVSNATK